MKPGLAWMTRTAVARVPLLVCLLLVRCSDAVLPRLAVRMLAEPMRTTTLRRQRTTLLPCLRFKTCLLMPQVDLAFPPCLRALLLPLRRTALLQLLPRPILRSRRRLLARRRPRRTSLPLGRWTLMRITMTMETTRRRPLPLLRVAPTAAPRALPLTAMESAMVAKALPPRPRVLKKNITRVFIRVIHEMVFMSRVQSALHNNCRVQSQFSLPSPFFFFSPVSFLSTPSLSPLFPASCTV